MTLVVYEWYTENVPEDISIRQVYGIVFSSDGKVVLRVDSNKYKLTGGKPEEKDANLEETLKREYIEELNIEIEEVYYLGYLLVEENNEKYAQVRMIAKVNKIGDNRPDMDNGKIYKRFMANQTNLKHYLQYEDIAGKQMLDDALELANKKYDFNILDNAKEYFI